MKSLFSTLHDKAKDILERELKRPATEDEIQTYLGGVGLLIVNDILKTDFTELASK